ncbi:MAG: DUF4292 domain-containing protein [Bacteroidetes bacterium]|nr:DUF4292 domain-containing protein [Bacteroidota bacterium]
MKYLKFLVAAVAFIIAASSCHTTKQIAKAIAPKDSTVVVLVDPTNTKEDSMKMIQATLDGLHKHYIDYKTFNAKIKVEYEDGKGKQPDILAVVRIVKDSAIWVSLSATILNIEVFRLRITQDSVVLMDIRNKEVQYRSLDYLQDVTEIPFDYKTIQDMLVGNPIFMDSSVVYYKKADDKILISTVGAFFKNLITLSADNNLLLHSKLDDVDVSRSRTADITYSDFEHNNNLDFSTYREITVSEKNKLDIRLNYRQYEFNKELSVGLKVPKNYKKK